MRERKETRERNDKQNMMKREKREENIERAKQTSRNEIQRKKKPKIKLTSTRMHALKAADCSSISSVQYCEGRHAKKRFMSLSHGAECLAMRY